MMFQPEFVAATKEYTTYEQHVPAPYIRKSFCLDRNTTRARISICGLGFYRLFVNGTEVTKGLLAPYMSNPDHIQYYDVYDVAEHLRQGENVLGILLGNGILNSAGGGIWEFDRAAFRSAPKVALSLDMTDEDGRKQTIETDHSFKTFPSPILFDDLRCGEIYDARREVPGWNRPGFDDSHWKAVISAQTPKGEFKLCTAEPIVKLEERKPVGIWQGYIGAQRTAKRIRQIPMEEQDKKGYIYDFGENLAGVVRLRITGERGQRISIQTGELLDENRNLDMRGMMFQPEAFNHRMVYTLNGEGEEEYRASFTYFGMRYCLVSGITQEQATQELLTFEVMSSALQKNGDFSCSDDVINRLQKATYNANISNFYYFPTDCPHREKNGWTGDAALSAEQLLFQLTAENSFRVWLDNIRKAQTQEGELPGIVPTSGWGYEDEQGGWNGPAWDSVVTYLPYYSWLYRGETPLVRAMMEENAPAMLRYLHYMESKRDRRGLLEYGLYDYVPILYKMPHTPLVTSTTLIGMDICRKCEKLFDVIGDQEGRAYAAKLWSELRRAARLVLIEPDHATVLGRNQSAQAMGLAYGLFEPGEERGAVEVLLHYIEVSGGRMDTGVLGGRVLFEVLAQHGHAELAYRMLKGPDYPSCGHWVVHEDCTALCESFKRPDNPNKDSRNHHFWGHISAWFLKYLAGIKINPYARDVNELEISPNFIPGLEQAQGYCNIPGGKVEVSWKSREKGIELNVTVPPNGYGFLRLPEGYYVPEGLLMKAVKRLEPGTTTYFVEKQDSLVV